MMQIPPKLTDEALRPANADSTFAIQKVREAVWTAGASIALGEPSR
jgi:hypothetical protein